MYFWFRVEMYGSTLLPNHKKESLSGYNIKILLLEDNIFTSYDGIMYIITVKVSILSLTNKGFLSLVCMLYYVTYLCFNTTVWAKEYLKYHV